MDEQELIPFEPALLRGERLLVLAPHPDDEAIACGGLLALHARDGREALVAILTDGARSERGDLTEESLVEARREESREGLRRLGGPEPRFLGLPDRSLSGSEESLAAAIADLIREFRPDLIVSPSPLEIHPDHAATARALAAALQGDAALRAAVPLCRIAFAEITQPIRPNALVDITAVAEAKEKAIEAHASQSQVRDYARFARGLNDFRTMTLPPGVTRAEAYHVIEAAALESRPLSAIAAEMSAAFTVRVEREPLDVTIVVRTRDRLPLLREALASIHASDPAARIVVVNDGGPSPRDIAGRSETVHIVEHAASVGRAEALNAGVRATKTAWIGFLDDDDLHYPEHLPTLARAAAAGSARAFYTDAVSAFQRRADDGSWEEEKRLRFFRQDFDQDLLFVDNYIPLPTLLVRTEDARELEFDRAFDLFEDWDFILRLSQGVTPVHIPRLTVEVRHFPGAGSVVLAQHAESDRFREAKAAVWRKHGLLARPASLVHGVERLKAAALREVQRAVEAEGRGRHLELDVTRLSREKAYLLERLAHEARRAAEAESLHAEVSHRCATALEEAETLRGAIASLQNETARLQGEEASLRGHAAGLDRDLRSSIETTSRLFAEIDRLNALVAQMQSTRAWKLHQTVERIRKRS